MPTILVIVAVTQVLLAHTVPLTPWKGGGFGMFASMDQLDTRFVRIELISEAGEHVPIAIDEFVRTADTADLLERVRAMPDRRSLERIASRVRSMSWTESAGTAVSSGDAAAADILSVEHVRVSVWVYLYDRSRRSLVPERIAELTVPGP